MRPFLPVAKHHIEKHYEVKQSQHIAALWTGLMTSTMSSEIILTD